MLCSNNEKKDEQTEKKSTIFGFIRKEDMGQIAAIKIGESDEYCL